MEHHELNYNFTRITTNKRRQRLLLNQHLSNCEFFCSKTDLAFSSAYESGNLYEAYEYEHSVYHLVLQNDCQTFGFASWFNFKVKNLLPTTKKVVFCIINMRRRASLYQQGMTPYMYTTQRGWQKVLRPVYYYRNGLAR
jgi:hypothetical protein